MTIKKVLIVLLLVVCTCFVALSSYKETDLIELYKADSDDPGKIENFSNLGLERYIGSLLLVQHHSHESRKYGLYKRQRIAFLDDYILYWLLQYGPYAHPVPRVLILNPEKKGCFINDEKDFSDFLERENIVIDSEEKALRAARLLLKTKNGYNSYYITDVSHIYKENMKKDVLTGKYMSKTNEPFFLSDIKKEKEKFYDDLDKIIQSPDVMRYGRDGWKIENLYTWNNGSIYKNGLKIESYEVTVCSEPVDLAEEPSVDSPSAYGYFIYYIGVPYQEYPSLPNNSIVENAILTDIENWKGR